MIGAARLFDPGTDDPAYGENSDRLGAWAGAYEALFTRASLPGGARISAMMVLYALVLGFGAARVFVSVRRERRFDGETAALAYAVLTVAYVVAVWVATDNGETFRARLLVEPLVLFVLLPLALRAAVAAARARRSARRTVATEQWW